MSIAIALVLNLFTMNKLKVRVF